MVITIIVWMCLMFLFGYSINKADQGKGRRSNKYVNGDLVGLPKFSKQDIVGNNNIVIGGYRDSAIKCCPTCGHSDVVEKITSSDIKAGNFVNSKITNVDLKNSDLKMSNFTNAKFTNVDLRGADFRDCTFTNAKFTNCTITSGWDDKVS